MRNGTAPPERQVRARFDDGFLTVYQAFSPEIAGPAVAAGTFVAPFKIDRMTWIKPSFLWMMYRCGWAGKPGQERVLAVRISRSSFDRALASACLSHFDPEVHGSYQEWRDRLKQSPVRVQWDPERSLDLAPLPWRAIQVGLSGEMVPRYLSEWIAEITDITELAHSVRHMVETGDLDGARSALPVEAPYPLPVESARAVKASESG